MIQVLQPRTRCNISAQGREKTPAGLMKGKADIDWLLGVWCRLARKPGNVEQLELGPSVAILVVPLRRVNGSQVVVVCPGSNAGDSCCSETRAFEYRVNWKSTVSKISMENWRYCSQKRNVRARYSCRHGISLLGPTSSPQATQQWIASSKSILSA